MFDETPEQTPQEEFERMMHSFMGVIPPMPDLSYLMSLGEKPRKPRHCEREVGVRTEPKIGRNEPCPCGSGKKYKKCCDDN